MESVTEKKTAMFVTRFVTEQHFELKHVCGREIKKSGNNHVSCRCSKGRLGGGGLLAA